MGCTPAKPPPDSGGTATVPAVSAASSSATVTTPSAKPARGPCKTDNDCGEHYYCSEGECHVQNLGRPLTVDGAAHVAASRPGRGWHGDALPDATGTDLSSLRAAAFEEHASIAAFSRTMCELLSLGAPAWLVGETQRALADEIEHARSTFAVLASLGAAPDEPGPLAAAVAPFGTTEELLRDVFWGGCVGETRAAHRAHALADQASTPSMRAFYTKIAQDESRHAALAFRTARWLIDARPHLRAVLDGELGEFDRAPVALIAPLLDVLRRSTAEAPSA